MAVASDTPFRLRMLCLIMRTLLLLIMMNYPAHTRLQHRRSKIHRHLHHVPTGNVPYRHEHGKERHNQQNDWLWQALHAWWMVTQLGMPPLEGIIHADLKRMAESGRRQFQKSPRSICLPDTWNCDNGGGPEPVDNNDKCMNYCHFSSYIHYIYYFHYASLRLIFIQLDFLPADIKHSSLRTMTKHV